ncbi:MAG: type II secretion system protein M [Gemmatimonadetes bacterium]|nr:type II secretion system protein M [Gemmatimonadota bacterium]
MSTARLRESLGLERLSGRDRRALRLGLVVAVPIVLWMAVVRPYRTALEDARARMDAERALLAREEALIASAASLPAGLERTEDEADRVDRRLVHASNVALVETRVTEVLEDLALDSRVLLEEMRGVQPDRQTADSAFVEPVLLAVQGESDLDGVTRFLHAIEENPLLLRVAELSIEPVTVRPQSGRQNRNEEPPAPQQTGVVRFALIVVAYAPPDLPERAAPAAMEQVP